MRPQTHTSHPAFIGHTDAPTID